MQELEDFVDGLESISTLMLRLRLELANRDVEGADQGLAETHENVVIAVASETRAVELLDRQLHVEGKHSVDVGVVTWSVRVSCDVGNGLSLLRR